MAQAKVPAHAARPLGIMLTVLGALMLAVAVACVLGASSRDASLLIPAVLGVFFLLMGTRVLREGPTVQSVNRALDRFTRGYVDEAEAILEAIPPRRRKHQLRRAIDIQRSMIALRRKDSAGAVAHATRAIEGSPSLQSYSQEQIQIIAARSLRAVASAGKDDPIGALADAAVVRQSSLATPDTLARASLAEAIVLSRAKERDKLSALLLRDRRLLLEFSTPRDRALVRALQRTVHARSGSAYREPPRPEPPPESELASWISHVAPAATGLASQGGAVASRAPTDEGDAPSTLRAKDAAAAVRKRGKSMASRVLILWIVLIVTFLGIWQFLTPPTSHAPPRAPSAPSMLASPFVYFGVFMTLFVGLTLWARRGLHKLTAATRLLLLDDLAPAEKAFTALTKSRAPIIAAQADAQLARLATRRAKFAEALVLVDRAIGRIAKLRGGTDLLLPNLLGRRAYLLAALDRPDDAVAELSTLASAHPTYPWAAGSQLIARMVLEVRRGDLAAASALAAQRTIDLPLSHFDELLADVLAANAEARPDEAEIDRLRGELQSDQELRGWLRATWPGGETALEDAKARAI